jgi:glucose-6-phosphate 1-dehydrogenase
VKTTILILGATGDLTKKKLIPAIHNLIKDKKLKDFVIVGAATSKVSSEVILNKSKPHIKNLNKQAWEHLKKRFYYHSTDFYDKKHFCGLEFLIKTLEKKYNLPGNRLIYLATLPQHFKIISQNLKDCGLVNKNKSKSWTRVVFEKPFGHNLNSAKKINNCIKSVFSEKQTYRIDHYLGKELVQNLNVLRFTNTFLEPIWNNKYIDHVQIILSENVGIETRGKFYDKYGALKDVVQNHMLQMLSLIAMEAPKKLQENCIRDEKLKILKSIKTTNNIILGQYQGYKNEKGVNKKSNTETFASLKLFVNNERWKNVPFYFITGKNMKDKVTTIHIEFKQTKCRLFHKVCNFNPNHLTLQIQPEEGFHLHINSKVPGKTTIVPVKMDFCHECTFGPNTPEAYENLLYDVMKGDQSVFIRSDEIEQQWKIIDKIENTKCKIQIYKKGSYPEQAKKLIEKEGRKWHLEVN